MVSEYFEYSMSDGAPRVVNFANEVRCGCLCEEVQEGKQKRKEQEKPEPTISGAEAQIAVSNPAAKSKKSRH